MENNVITKEYLVECFMDAVDTDKWTPVEELVTEMLAKEGYGGEIQFSLELEDMVVYGDKDNVRYTAKLDFDLVVRTFLETSARYTAEMCANYFLNNKEIYSTLDD